MAFWNNNNNKTPSDEPISKNKSTPTSNMKSEKPAAASEGAPVNANKHTAAAEPSTTSSQTIKSREESALERYGKVRSALGTGTVIQGKLSFDTVVSIDGKLSGEIFSSKALLIGKSGIVDAQIEVAALVVQGVVKGSIKATERIEILSGGQILGDVSTPALIMEEGCIFSGNCSMASGQKVVSVRSTDSKSTEAKSAPVRPSTVQPEPAKPEAETEPASLH